MSALVFHLCAMNPKLLGICFLVILVIELIRCKPNQNVGDNKCHCPKCSGGNADGKHGNSHHSKDDDYDQKHDGQHSKGNGNGGNPGSFDGVEDLQGIADDLTTATKAEGKGHHAGNKQQPNVFGEGPPQHPRYDKDGYCLGTSSK